MQRSPGKAIGAGGPRKGDRFTITGPAPGSARICGAILRALPQWFGIESALRRTEDWLRGQGCRLLQVKTLSASRRNSHYAATRAFYLDSGFLPLEELPELWSKANPCLILVKPLKNKASRTHSRGRTRTRERRRSLPPA